MTGPRNKLAHMASTGTDARAMCLGDLPRMVESANSAGTMMPQSLKENSSFSTGISSMFQYQSDMPPDHAVFAAGLRKISSGR